MLNYISSELYKTFRRKYTKIALVVIALLCIAGNALVRLTFFDGGYAEFRLSFLSRHYAYANVFCAFNHRSRCSFF